MKKLFLTIVSISLFYFCFCQRKEPHSIKVTYVECSIETTFAIPCTYFDSSFLKEKILGQLKNSEILKHKASLKNFVKIKSNGIDVRGKIEYLLNGNKYKYCFGCSGIFTDGSYYYKNITLFKFLKKKFNELNY